ncbi:hypothetical protein K523DRAFT_338920 [Schizophyllum commune Tattone D]|nr:hypothetical protein K523DRAFT_338920 [Schizophyllum commune Tattone D]
MSSLGPPKYLCSRVIRELRRHGLDRHRIPPNFFSSRLYRDVLDSLDVSNIPKASALNREQWRNIVNAADSMRAIAYLMKAGESGSKAAPSEACNRIVFDSLSSLWAWSQYLHPFLRNCDEDALEAATKLYQWQFLDLGRGWHYAAVSDVLLALSRCTAPDMEISALQATPGSASLIYDLWWYMAHETGDAMRDAALMSTLALFAFDDPDRHVARAIVLKGAFGVESLVRRLCTLLDVKVEKPNFRAIFPFVYLLAQCAECDEGVRPCMYPLIWRVCPMLRLVDYSAGDADEAEDNYLMLYSGNCLYLLSHLSGGLRGTRDIIRLVRQGLLQAMFRYLNHFSDPVRELSVNADIMERIISPAIFVPSVANAVNGVFQRYGLFLDPRKRDFDPWNEMRVSLHKILEFRKTYKAEKKTMQFCHNRPCDSVGHGKFKRCSCGWAFYCSKSCQASDWPNHRTVCQTKVQDPDASSFRIGRPSDIRFLQFYAYRLLAARDDFSSEGARCFEVNLTSDSIEPVITVLSDSNAAEERTVSVIVGTRTAKTSLVFPLPAARFQ